MNEQRMREIVREELAKRSEAAASPASIIEKQIELLEAKKAWALIVTSNRPVDQAFEAALKSIDCSVQSLRQRLEELRHQRAYEGI